MLRFLVTSIFFKRSAVRCLRIFMPYYPFCIPPSFMVFIHPLKGMCKPYKWLERDCNVNNVLYIPGAAGSRRNSTFHLLDGH